MKSKSLRISILMIMVSFVCALACGFAFMSKERINTYATDLIYQECNLLMGQDGNPYTSNSMVGLVSGGGKFVVGHEDVELTATANENYQLAGWYITYQEQSNATQFVDASNLTDNKKTAILTAKDGATISAQLQFEVINGYAKSGTFMLASVFENLIVAPVFDHIYYNVNVDDLSSIDFVENHFSFDGNVVYYKNFTTVGGVTTYSNAIIYNGENYYYYGNLKKKVVSGEDFYFTAHKTQTEQQQNEEVEFSRGAFRIGDNVNLKMTVDIDEADIKNSENIDFVGASVESNSVETLKLYNADASTNNYFKRTQDSYSRTKDFELNFVVATDSNYINTINFDCHDLYVVDLKILVDGSDSHNETEDVFGSVKVEDNELLSNISLYNFHAQTNTNNLQYLVKKAQNNNSRAFGVVCAKSINKIIEGNSFRYYTFNSLNTLSSNTQYFADIDSNMVVTVDYSSVLYDVMFQSFEYVEDADKNVSLYPFEANVLDKISVKRGTLVSLDATSVQDVENVGYKFVGYATSVDGQVEKSLDFTIDKTKPSGKLILLCYQKIEYKIVLTNYNKVNVGSLTAINSVAFNLNNIDSTIVETVVSSALIEQTYQLTNKLVLNGNLKISTQINNGFDVLGYSLVAPEKVTTGDYINKDAGITLTKDFIKENNIEDTIIIYVYESIKYYSLTYSIAPGYDSEQKTNVIMANIDAISSGATILKYDNSGKLISEENGNLKALVAKIVVSNLTINSEVNLTSEAITAGTAPNTYTYLFNYFTEVEEDGAYGKLMLSHTQSGNVYQHDETIVRDREIKVVYTMPNTKVIISIEEDFAQTEAFEYAYSVKVDGENAKLEDGTTNSYMIEVGDTATITIEELGFGYVFDGYQVVGESTPVDVAGLSFDYNAKSGVNTLVLKFSRIQYRFIFEQYGAGFNGQQYSAGFNLNDEEGTENDYYYTELDIDNSILTLTKPLGYYVSTVKFANGVDTYSSALSENNNSKFNADITKYSFNLTREQIIDLIENHSQTNKGVTKVYVRLDYLVFTYQVEVSYKLTNPKNDYRDSFVQYPTIVLNYVLDGHDYVAIKTINEQTLTFADIPYGANATLSVSSGAPTGLTVSGWRYSNDDIISQDEYQHSSNELKVGTMTADKVFLYKLTYNAYELNVVYNSKEGTPETYINNQIITSETKQITAYDSLEIVSNATRDNGYKFKCFSYKKPVYTIYDGDSWEDDHDKLYIKVGGNYEKAPSVKQDGVTYYSYSEEIVVVTDTVFLDESFSILDYALQNKKIVITVEYELLQISIVNNLSERAEDENFKKLWKLTGRGNDGSKIQFNLNDLALFTISATDKEGITRTITSTDVVTYNDVVTILVNINKAAQNIDGTIYDLSLGLKLGSVQIGDKFLSYELVKTGEYKITFNVSENIPTTGETLTINYVLEIAKKTINVTTVVSNSTEFYKNIKMYINAREFGFDISPIESTNNATYLEHGLQFLSKTRCYSAFTTSTYLTNFKIGGVKIYSNGSEISPNDRAKFGITVDEDNWNVVARMIYDIDVVFKVQPILTYNGGPAFAKIFECDKQGNGIAQQLSLGSSNGSDIQIAEMLVSAVKIKYVSIDVIGLETTSVIDCGKYKVVITFENLSDYNWLSEISVAEDITLTIVQKDIYISYNQQSIKQTSKTYDGQSDYLAENVYKYLMFRDSVNKLQINYSTLMNSGKNDLIIENAEAFISTSGVDGRIAVANETVYYNIYVYNISLKDTPFNKNFNLINNDLIINNYIQIKKKQVEISGLSVYNKVYDGTDSAELYSTDGIKILNVIPGDEVIFNDANLNIKFENAEIGTNKKVIINAEGVISGRDVSNYYINDIEVSGLTIYPYSISAHISGLGEIKVINKRGLQDKEKVNLIPLNATLKVEPIYADSKSYASIHRKISGHIKGNNEYAIGYKLHMLVGGEDINISNDLYLSIPNVKNLTGVYFLTGAQSGKIEYSFEENRIVVDLNEINNNVNTLFLTQKKILLKVWQLVLIIVLFVLVVIAVILVFVIIRKRKKDNYSVNEKI